MSSIGHITWVTPERLERNWLPEYFAPRFHQLDEALLADPGSFVSLSEMVSVTNAPRKLRDLPTYIVRRRGGSMAIEQLGSSEKLTEKERWWIPLPDECVVLDAMVFDGKIAATFWTSRIFGRDAATTPNSYVLIPKGRRDVAWIEAVLFDPLVTAQLERTAIGGLLPRIHLADLLEVRLPRLSPEKQRDTSELVRRALTKRSELLRLSAAARSRSGYGGGELAAGAPVLTAATFEERMEQFERLLIEDQLADQRTGFFVQAARDDRESDLFVIRPIVDIGIDTQMGPLDSTLRSEEDEDANRAWRQWYWDSDSGIDYQVFNALTGGPELPTYLLLRSIADPRALPVPVPGRVMAPGFAEFRAAVEASRDVDSELDVVKALLEQGEGPRGGASEIGRLWERLNPGTPPNEHVISWLRSMFRPVLAIRTLRDNRVAGAYLLFGADQLEDPSGATAHLEILGERLIAVLRQPSQIAQEAARSESLRRLSWVMHQLAGPLTRIGNVVEELMGFATVNPKIAAALLPDDDRARMRAEMNKLPLEEYTLGVRLMKLEAAVEEIRRLQYLIRRYKNAQGEIQVAPFDLRELLDELAVNARELFADLQVRVDCDEGLVVVADRGLIRTALAEVVNNACRECRIRGVANPTLVLVGMQQGNRVRITIEDNGLPANIELLPDVFAEDASTYRAQGKGSGLGLAIVKETFLRHGHRCGLVENTTTDGLRRPGVTFWADIDIKLTPEEDDLV